MKLFIAALFFISANALAENLSCLCTSANGYRAELSCKKFVHDGDCHFEDRIESQNVVWQQAFKASSEGILFSWSTNGGGRQEKVLKLGSPFDFKYDGDNDTYTMICDLQN